MHGWLVKLLQICMSLTWIMLLHLIVWLDIQLLIENFLRILKAFLHCVVASSILLRNLMSFWFLSVGSFYFSWEGSRRFSLSPWVLKFHSDMLLCRSYVTFVLNTWPLSMWKFMCFNLEKSLNIFSDNFLFISFHFSFWNSKCSIF